MQPMPFCLLRSECSETGILASSTISVHQKVSMLSKICIVFKIKIPANTSTNNMWSQKVTLIRILVFGLKYSNNIRIPNYSLTSVVNTRTFCVWGFLCRPAIVIRGDLWTRSFWPLFIFVSTPFIILVAFHTILGSRQNDKYFYQNAMFLLDIRDGISRDIHCFLLKPRRKSYRVFFFN